MRSSSNGLALICDQKFVHTNLLWFKESAASTRTEVKIKVDWARRTDDLGSNCVHVHFFVKDVNIEVALEGNELFVISDATTLSRTNTSVSIACSMLYCLLLIIERIGPNDRYS